MKAVTLVSIWLVASVAAVVVAFQGVGLVDAGVIGPRSAPAAAVPAIASVDPAGPAEATEKGTNDSLDDDDDDDGAFRASSANPAPSPGDDGEDNPGFVVDLSKLAQVTATPAAAPNVGATPETRPTPTARSTAPRPTPTPTRRRLVDPTPDTASPQPRQAATPKPTPTRTPALQPTPVPNKPKPTSTPAPTAVSTQVATSTPTPAPTPTKVPSQVVTFNLVGGSTGVSFSPSAVTVLWASPAPGFSAEVGSSSTVRVEFRSDDGDRSRIDAWWAGGAQWDIREDHD